MSNDDRQTNEQIWNQLKTIKNFAFPCGIKTLENPIKELKLKTQRTNDKTLHTEKKKKPTTNEHFYRWEEKKNWREYQKLQIQR